MSHWLHHSGIFWYLCPFQLQQALAELAREGENFAVAVLTDERSETVILHFLEFVDGAEIPRVCLSPSDTVATLMKRHFLVAAVLAKPARRRDVELDTFRDAKQVQSPAAAAAPVHRSMNPLATFSLAPSVAGKFAMLMSLVETSPGQYLGSHSMLHARTTAGQ